MKNIFDIVFARGGHVCPWWLCFTFDNVFRKLFQNPERILSEYIKPGYTILDIGPGRGYFTLPMARMAGTSGRVYAVDIQPRMLQILGKKAARQKLDKRIVTLLADGDNPPLDDPLDFALAFWMVHEVPDCENFLAGVYRALKPGGRFLIAEPFVHVTGKKFENTVMLAIKTGFRQADRPRIFGSRAVLLVK